MNTLVVRIPEEQKIALKLLANSKNLSVARITREAIEEYISKMAKSEENLLLKLAKIGERKKVTVPKDLSRNYKQYLYGEVQK